MERIRTINISLAVFIAVCFILPWVQFSCGGAHDSESGIELAQQGDRLLWLIPLFMFVVVVLGLGRGWKNRAGSFALASVLSGALTAFLMNRERVYSDSTGGLFAASMTAWYWFGLAAAIGLAIGGLAILWYRSREPRESP